MDGISISTSDETPTPQAREMAITCLRGHAAKVGGAVGAAEKPLAVVASFEGRLIGGMIGKVFCNWLYADLVWVEEEFRGRGIGSRVMQATEERAREMKLSGIYLWTQTWQAPGFYKKLGFTQFVEFKNFPPGHSRLGFLRYLE